MRPSGSRSRLRPNGWRILEETVVALRALFVGEPWGGRTHVAPIAGPLLPPGHPELWVGGPLTRGDRRRRAVRRRLERMGDGRRRPSRRPPPSSAALADGRTVVSHVGRDRPRRNRCERPGTAARRAPGQRPLDGRMAGECGGPPSIRRPSCGRWAARGSSCFPWAATTGSRSWPEPFADEQRGVEARQTPDTPTGCWKSGTPSPRPFGRRWGSGWRGDSSRSPRSTTRGRSCSSGRSDRRFRPAS